MATNDFGNSDSSIDSAERDETLILEETTTQQAQLASDETSDIEPVDATSSQVVASPSPEELPSKVAADSNNVVRLPASASIEKVEVQGSDLVLKQPDGTQITITNAAAKIPTFYLGDVEIPSTVLVAALQTNGIDVAAGSSGSLSVVTDPTSSGGNFGEPVPDIGKADPILDTLPYTELAFPQPELEELYEGLREENDEGNPVPDVGGDTQTVYEDGLADGNPHGADSETVTGSFTVTHNGETFTLTVGGTPITSADLEASSFPAEIDTGEGLLTITGYTEATATGVVEYSYTLKAALTHSGQGEINPLSDTITLSVTDATGDTDLTPGSIVISIVDDIPVANVDSDSVIEGETATGNVLTGGPDAVDSNTTDGEADTSGADGWVSTGGVVGVTHPANASSGNVTDGFEIVGTHGTLELAADGTYTYTPNNNVDQDTNDDGVIDGVDTPITDVFTYTVEDGDGDQTTATLTITVNDGAGPTTDHSQGSPVELAVDEEGLDTSEATGSAEDTSDGDEESTAERDTGTVTFTAGSDDIAAADIVFDTSTDGLNAITTDFDGIAGPDIVWSAPSSTQIIGTIGSITAITLDLVQPVATIAAGADGNATINVTLSDNFPHPDGADENTITLSNITVTATDTDGSAVTAYATVTVTDDVPTAVNDSDSVIEGETATGNVLTGGPDAVDSNITDGEADTSGADGWVSTGGVVGVTHPANASSGNVTDGFEIVGTHGTLELAADGTYTYTPNNNVDQDTNDDGVIDGVDTPITDVFTYTVEDGDGDQTTATLTITVNDGAGPTTDHSQGSPVELAVDEEGLDTSEATGSAEDTSDGDEESTAERDTGTVTFTAGSDDIAAADIVFDTSTDGLNAITTDFDGIAGPDIVWSAPSSTQIIGTIGSITAITLDLVQPVATIAAGADGNATINVTLSDNFPHPDGADENTITLSNITVTATDTDGSAVTAYATVTVTDDVPTAVNDSDSVIEGETATGNVLTGGPDAVDSNITDGEADTSGADGWVSTGGVVGVTHPANASSGNVTDGFEIVGTHGTLELAADGTYTYTPNNNVDQDTNDDGVIDGVDTPITDVFTYTVEDGDGDQTTATLTITVNDGAGPTTDHSQGSPVELAVDEEGLDTSEATGSAEDTSDGDEESTAERDTGTVTFTAGSDDIAAADIVFDTSTDGLNAITTDFDGIAGPDIVWSAPSSTQIIGTIGSITAITLDLVQPVATIAAGADGNATINVTLSDNFPHPDGADENTITLSNITVTATDTDGSAVTAYATVTVTDDVPTAVNDSDSVIEGETATGNVLTGGPDAVDSNITDGEADTSGADGWVSTGGVVGVTHPANASSGNVTDGFEIVGTHGTLELAADGTYTYTPNNNVDQDTNDDGVIDGVDTPITDVFTYTVEDGDGDQTTATLTITVNDGAGPTTDHSQGSPVELAVDEEGLDTSEATGSAEDTSDGDEESTAERDTGTVTFTAGSDDIAAADIVFDTSTDGLNAITTDFDGIAGPDIVWSAPSSTQIIGTIGSITAITLDLVQPVATIAAGADGNATINVTLSDNFPHPDGADENTITLSNITVTATDTDGSAVTAYATVTVTDDVPTAVNDSDSVIEGETATGNVLTGGPDAVDSNITDGEADTSGADGWVSTGGVVGVTHPANASSGNVTDGFEIVGTHGTLELAADGTYTYTPNNNVDQDTNDDGVIDGVDTPITDVFTYTVEDGDGDQTTATLTITVNDGAGPTTDHSQGSPVELAVDEEGLDTSEATGSAEDTSDGDEESTAERDTGTVTFTAGSDDIAAADIVFDTSTDGLNAITTDFDGIAGPDIVWSAPSSTQIIGTIGSITAITLDLVQPVATIAAGADGNATINVTLSDNFPHPDGADENTITLSNITVTATDTDGSAVTAYATVTVTDDVPTAVNDSDSVIEGETATGNVLTGGPDAVDSNITDGEADTSGADGWVSTGGVVGVTHPANASSGNVTDGFEIVGTHGTLELAADGTYTYTPNNNVDQDTNDDGVIDGVDTPITDVFTYTVEDGDGDQTTATLTITVNDGAGPTTDHSQGSPVELAVDEEGLDTSEATGSAEDTSDGDEESTAERDTGTVTFTAGSDDIAAADIVFDTSTDGLNAITTDFDGIAGPDIVWSAPSSTQIIGTIGSITAITLDLVQPVATIAAGADGNATINVTLSDNFPHPDGADENTITLSNITVTATDTDGSAVTAYATVTVTDDVPTAVNDSDSVIEGETATGNVLTGGPDAVDSNITDGEADTSGADGWVSTGGVVGVTHPANASSGNVTDGFEIVGTHGTLELAADGTYTYTPNNNVDQDTNDDGVIDGVDTPITDVFTYTVEDGDGDQTTATLTITVNDGAGPTTDHSQGSPVELAVDEEGLDTSEATGSAEDTSDGDEESTAERDTGTVTFTAGSDDIAAADIVFDTSTDGLNAITTDFDGIAGPDIVWSAPSSTQIIGTIGSITAITLDLVQPVATIAAGADGNATINVTLSDNFPHPDGADENTITLSNITVTATDTDGSAVTAYATVTVTDDVPTAVNDSDSVIEGETATGNVLTGGPDAVDSNITDGEADTSGADGWVSTGGVVGVTHPANASSGNVTDGFEIVGTHGTLELAADGTYTYTPNNNVDQDTNDDGVIDGVDTPITDVFTYTVEDGDGDQTTATLTITVNDGAGPTTDHSQGSPVELAVDEEGLDTSEATGSAEDTSDGDEESTAERDTGTVTFTAGSDDIAAADIVFDTSTDGLNAITTDFDGIAGPDIVWSAPSSTQIIGTIGSITAITLDLVQPVATIAAGADGNATINVTLSDNFPHPDGADENTITLSNITVTATDTDGSAVTAYATVTVTDDVPTAVNDSDSVIEGETATGNVLTGGPDAVDSNITDGEADTSGADGWVSTGGVVGVTHPANASSGNVTDGFEIVGTHGTLELAADGTYTYTPNNNVDQDTNDDGVIDGVDTPITDVFTYTVEDGDGDQTTATLTITVNDGAGPTTDHSQGSPVELAVDEEGLDTSEATGSAEDTSDGDEESTAERDTGTVTFTAGSDDIAAADIVFDTSTDGLNAITTDFDGIAGPDIVWSAPSSTQIIGTIGSITAITLDLVQPVATIAAGADGNATINVTLSDNFPHPDGADENTITLSNITVTATDTDGSAVTAYATVTVTDDVPTAVNDSDSVIEGETATGNVLTGGPDAVDSNITDGEADTSGADGWVSTGGVVGVTHPANASSGNVTDGFEIVGTHGTLELAADGTYTYTPNNNVDQDTNDDGVIDGVDTPITDVFTYTVEDGDGDQTTATLTITVNDGAGPTTDHSQGSPVELAVDEEGLDTSEATGSAEDTSDGDEESTAERDTGTVTFTAGSDDIAAADIVFDTSTDGLNAITTDFDGIAGPDIVWSAPSSTQIIGTIGSITAITLDLVQPVATIAAGADGNATINVTLSDNFPHPDGADENTITLSNITVTATDTDGSAVTAYATVTVTDDVPTAVNDSDSVIEGETATGNVLTGGPDAVDSNITDGEADTSGADGWVSTGGVVGVTHPANASSGNVTDGFEIVGTHGTLELAADGTYTYTPNNNVDQDTNDDGVIDGVDTPITDVFTYTVEDGDGDQTTATLTITVNDGAGPTTDHSQGSPVELAVDEEGLDTSEATGSAEDTSDGDEESTAERDTGTVTFTAGSDDIAAADIVFDTSTDGLNAITTDFDGIAGPDIVWSAPSSTQIIGTIGSITAITLDLVQPVATIAAGADGNATINVTLSDNFPHPDGADENTITLSNITVTATDTDGSAVTAYATVTVTDDVPTAVNDSDSVIEGETATGNVLTGGPDAVDSNITDGEADTSGADGWVSTGGVVGVTHPANASSGNVTDGFEIVGTHGTLELAADGTYTYTPNNNVDQDTNDDGVIDGVDTPITDVFTYTVEDGDGDQTTATLTITVNDGAGPTTDHSQGSPVELAVDEEGLDTSEATGSAEDTSDGDEESTAERDTGTVTFTAGSDDIAAADIVFDTSTDGLNAITTDFDGIAGPDIVWSAPSSTQIIGTIGSITAITLDLVQPVATIAAGADGNATINVTLSDNFPHPDGADENTITLSNITVTATDTDGSAVTAYATVTVTDDVPTAVNDSDSVIEGETATGNVLTGGPDAVDSNITDGEADTSGADGWVSTGGVVGVTHPANASSGNVTDGFEIVGTHGTLELAADGTYTYTPNNNVDQDTNDDGVIDGVDTPITDVFTYTVEDGDGDQTTATLTITVNDGAGPTTDHSQGSPVELAVDEEGLDTSEATGSAEDTSDGDEESTAERDTGTVTFTAGSDDIAAADIVFDTSTDGLNAITTDFDGIAGPDIVWSAPSSTQIIGTIGSITAITLDLVQPVATIAAGADGNATINVTLSDNFPHPDGADENTITLSNITVTATDTDGSAVTAYATVTVIDDVPTVDVTGTPEAAVVLQTQDADTDGANSDTAVTTAAFTGVFSIDSQEYGADGAGTAGSLTYSLSLATAAGVAVVNGTDSGLDAGNGAGTSSNIYLHEVAGVIYGSTLETSISVNDVQGAAVFTIAVDGSGIVTLTQISEIQHDGPGVGENYSDQLATLANDLVQLTASATVIDDDGDTATDSETVDLGGNIKFADDGPSIDVEECVAIENAVNETGTGTINIYDPGADNGTISIVGETNGANQAIDINGNLLISAGDPIYYEQSGDTLYAVTTPSDLSTVVFTINPDTGAGTFIVTMDDTKTLDPVQEEFNINLAVSVDSSGPGDPYTSEFETPDGSIIPVELFAFGASAELNVSSTGIGVNNNLVTAGGGQTVGAYFNGSILSKATLGLTKYRSEGDDEFDWKTIQIDEALFDLADYPDGTTTGNEYTLTEFFDSFVVVNNNLQAALTEGGSLTTIGAVVSSGTIEATDNENDDVDIEEFGDSGPSFNFIYVKATSGQFKIASISVTGSDGVPPILANFTATVTDGDGDVATDEFKVQFDAPLTSSASALIVNEAALTVGSDPTSGADSANGGISLSGGEGPFTYALTDPATSSLGTLTLNSSDGTYTYLLTSPYDPSPDADNSTNTAVSGDSFGYTVTDNNGNVTSGTISIDIVDDVPTALADTNSVVAGTDVASSVAGNVLTDGAGDEFGADGPTTTLGGVVGVDPGNDTGTPVTGSLGTGIDGDYGTLTLYADGSYNYVTDPTKIVSGQDEQDSFVYTIKDADGDTSTTTLTIDVDGAKAWLNTDDNEKFSNDIDDSITTQGNLIDAISLNGEIEVTTFTIFGTTYQAGETVLLDSSSLTNFHLDKYGTFTVQSNDFNNYSPNPVVTYELSDGFISETSTLTFKSEAGKLNSGKDKGTNESVTIQEGEDIWGNLLARGTDQKLPRSLAVGTNTHDAFVVTKFEVDGTEYTVPASGSKSATILDSSSNFIGTLSVSKNGSFHFESELDINTSDDIIPEVTYYTNRSLYTDGKNINSFTTVEETSTLNITITDIGGTPPVILDLDGDGIETIDLNLSTTTFDFDGDGNASKTAWVGSDDGLLAIDLNDDGRVNDGSEIVFTQYADGSKTDLEGLSIAFDTNEDGKLSAEDEQFDKFGVWQDADSDGVTDEGEFMSLVSLGIETIGLVNDGNTSVSQDGSVTTFGYAEYTNEDGSIGIVGDVALASHTETQIDAALANGLDAISEALMDEASTSEVYMISKENAAEIIADFQTAVDEIDLSELLTLACNTDVEAAGLVHYNEGTGDLIFDAEGNAEDGGGDVVANIGSGLSNETIKILFNDGDGGTGSDLL